MAKGARFELRTSSFNHDKHNNSHRRRRSTTTKTMIQRSSLEEYIPSYLRRFVHPYHGDFCVSQAYHPRILAQLMAEGFLPIATTDVLLPKLHAQRCVIPLQGQDSPLHISKSTRKKSKRFFVTVNQAFDRVVDGCHDQHGDRCWLYPRLVQVFETMHSAEHVPAVIVKEPKEKVQVCPVRLYSVEVWNVETGALAGGEIGYTVGSIYTSLTGFSRENSAGSVQLAALGKLLQTRGFSMWDMGMEMEYKTSLGCQLMSRDEFVQHVHAVRHAKGYMTLPIMEFCSKYNAKDVVDQQVNELELPSSLNVNTSIPRAPPVPQTGRVHEPSPKPEPQRTKRHKKLKAPNAHEEQKSDKMMAPRTLSPPSSS